MLPRTLEWTGDALRLLDQTRLPGETAYLDCTEVRHVWDAIKRLSVRGAPAIGVAAAYGAYLSIARAAGAVAELAARLGGACDHLATSRPTAVNLFWALDRIRALAPPEGHARPHAEDADAFKARVLAECHAMRDEDAACCQRIGEHGLDLLLPLRGPDRPLRLLTHCNAGALATCGIGTALAPIYVARERGVPVEVFADETRPLGQGARLTAYELARAGVPVTVLCDNMAASLLSGGTIDAVIVGADRIAANGDTANKIGTLGVAILARHFGVPVFVAAPTSTFDLSLGDGSKIPIEHRSADEVPHPDGARVFNPAFDVTPAGLIRGWITETGPWAPRTA